MKILYKIIQLFGWTFFWLQGKKAKDKLALVKPSFFKVLSLFFNIDNKLTRPQKDLTIKNRHGIYLCRANTDDAVIASTCYERLLVKKFFKHIKEGVFIDVGANIGKYTVMVARQIDGYVRAFEPDEKTYLSLLENLGLNNLTNVIAYNFACWNKETMLKLDKSTSTTGSYSVKSDSDLTVEVCAQRLDYFIKYYYSPIHIKIDVEGAEVEVLEGAKEVLKSNPSLLIEVQEDNLEKVNKIVNRPSKKLYRNNYKY
jgi:FkbM family methyltransferase